MKIDCYINQPGSSHKAIDMRSAHCSNKKEFILIEYNGFKLRVLSSSDK